MSDKTVSERLPALRNFVIDNLLDKGNNGLIDEATEAIYMDLVALYSNRWGQAHIQYEALDGDDPKRVELQAKMDEAEYSYYQSLDDIIVKHSKWPLFFYTDDNFRDVICETISDRTTLIQDLAKAYIMDTSALEPPKS